MKEIIIYITKLGNINENLIPKEQLERVKAYRSKKARVESLSGTTLLMEVLLEKNFKNPRFTYNKFGKPYLFNNEFYFNISHSYDYLCLALADQEIGIDLELIDSKAARVKKKFTEMTTNGDEKDFYTKLWVLKEAFMKYLGVGMTIPLKEIVIKVLNQEKNLFNVSFKNKGTICQVIKYEGYYLSVCLDDVSEYTLNIIER